MIAVRGGVVTGIIGLCVALVVVPVYATAETESDLAIALAAVLVVVNQSQLLPVCDITVYPREDIGLKLKLLPAGCTLRLNQNSQVVSTSESIDFNRYLWLSPHNDQPARLYLQIKQPESSLKIIFPVSDNIPELFIDLKTLSAEGYRYQLSYRKQIQQQAVITVAANVVSHHSSPTLTGSGSGGEDNDPNWRWRLWRWIRNYLLCGSFVERDKHFPDVFYSSDSSKLNEQPVDIRKRTSITPSEETVLWTLQRQEGPPGRPVNPCAPQPDRSANPASQEFSAGSDDGCCFSFRRRTNRVINRHDRILLDFCPVNPQQMMCVSESIETQLNFLGFSQEPQEPQESGEPESSIVDSADSGLGSELPLCSEQNPALEGGESFIETEPAFVELNIDMSPSHQEASGYIHLDIFNDADEQVEDDSSSMPDVQPGRSHLALTSSIWLI